MRSESDLEEKVAALSASNAGCSLSCQPDALSLPDAFRDPDVEGALLHDDLSVRRCLWRAQCNGARGVVESILEVDQDPCMMILAARTESGMWSSATAGGEAAEERFEKVTEAGIVATETCAAELVACIPAGRWMKLLSCFPVGAKLVVGGTLLRILQHFVSFTELLETNLGICLLADIGMILACQLAVGTLDLVLGGVTLDPHNGIVVFEIHARILLEKRLTLSSLNGGFCAIFQSH